MRNDSCTSSPSVTGCSWGVGQDQNSEIVGETIMTNSKWLRHALLGGVALSVASTGAQADELSALKAQLEALQSRVNQLESAPAPAALPDGASLITFKRGQGSLSDWNVDKKSEGRMPQDTGLRSPSRRPKMGRLPSPKSRCPVMSRAT